MKSKSKSKNIVQFFQLFLFFFHSVANKIKYKHHDYQRIWWYGFSKISPKEMNCTRRVSVLLSFRARLVPRARMLQMPMQESKIQPNTYLLEVWFLFAATIYKSWSPKILSASPWCGSTTGTWLLPARLPVNLLKWPGRSHRHDRKRLQRCRKSFTNTE